MRTLVRFAIVPAAAVSLWAQPIAVRQMEGQVRGFLTLRADDGAVVADGDSMQTTRNGRVLSRSIFHFRDGSLQDETTTFTQNGHFRVLSDHLVQKGPAFKHPIDLMINALNGQVTVIYTDEKGNPKTDTKHMDLPPDLANGMVPVLLKNLAPGTQLATESMVVASPSPMLIKLQIRPEGDDPFSTGGTARKATRYNVHVDIGGVKGVVATVIGKQPPDTTVWILKDECPAFVRAEGPGFADGPIWRTELAGPVFPNAASIPAKK